MINWIKSLFEPCETKDHYNGIVHAHYEGGDLICYSTSGNVDPEELRALHKKMISYKHVHVDGVTYKIKTK